MSSEGSEATIEPDEKTKPQRQSVSFAALIGLVCLVPLGFLFFDLWCYPYLISGGLAMRIVAAGLLCEGETPYIEFWDWTQPIVFTSLQYLNYLCLSLSSFHVPVIAASFVPWCLFGLMVISLMLLVAVAWQALTSEQMSDGKVEQKNSVRDFALTCAFAVALTAFITRFDFGELQYVLMFLMAPWLLLRWLAHEQLYPKGKIATALAAVVGLLAGTAACFDVPYLFVFVILELTLLLQSLKWRSLVSIEWCVFVGVFATNLIVLMGLKEPVKTAFWQWTMPLKWLNYSILDPAIIAPLSSPNRVDIVYCLVGAGLLALILSKKYTCFAPAVSLMLAGLGLSMLEGQGFSHDFILTIFALVFIFCSATIILFRLGLNYFVKQKDKPALTNAPLFNSILLALSLSTTVLVWQSLEHDRSRLLDYISANLSKGNLPLNLALEKTSKVNSRVTVLSPYVEPAYPLMLFSGRKPGGYLLWGRPLWLFKWMSDNSALTGSMKDFHAYTWSTLEAEIAQHRTDMFVASDDKVLSTFDREKFFRALRQGYSEVDTTGEYFSLDNHQPHEYCGSNPTYRFFVKRREQEPERKRGN